ncbi:MAG TPA: hypothetical protein VNE00_12230 [Paraburkholderia sp.]|nr:hypothetical protein [Paraburkholderia sp.]
MAHGEPIDAGQLREVSERARLFIYATSKPIRRLVRDVADIGRFDGPGALTPQLRLTLAAPPLVPASAEILEAAVRICGNRLFAQPGRMLLDSMALLGPIAAAEAFILLMADSQLTAELKVLGDAFVSVFERHPRIFLEGTRRLLDTYLSGSQLSGGA